MSIGPELPPGFEAVLEDPEGEQDELIYEEDETPTDLSSILPQKRPTKATTSGDMWLGCVLYCNLW